MEKRVIKKDWRLTRSVDQPPPSETGFKKGEVLWQTANYYRPSRACLPFSKLLTHKVYAKVDVMPNESGGFLA
jgi:hypothetical protein